MINFLINKLSQFYFKRSLQRDIIGLDKDDIDWLESHASRLKRISETMKQYILSQTFHSLTVRDHQRRKDWYDCLTAIQKLCDNSVKKEQIDWLTMKPKTVEKK